MGLELIKFRSSRKCLTELATSRLQVPQSSEKGPMSLEPRSLGSAPGWLVLVSLTCVLWIWFCKYWKTATGICLLEWISIARVKSITLGHYCQQGLCWQKLEAKGKELSLLSSSLLSFISHKHACLLLAATTGSQLAKVTCGLQSPSQNRVWFEAEKQ